MKKAILDNSENGNWLSAAPNVSESWDIKIVQTLHPSLARTAKRAEEQIYEGKSGSGEENTSIRPWKASAFPVAMRCHPRGQKYMRQLHLATMTFCTIVVT